MNWLRSQKFCDISCDMRIDQASRLRNRNNIWVDTANARRTLTDLEGDVVKVGHLQEKRSVLCNNRRNNATRTLETRCSKCTRHTDTGIAVRHVVIDNTGRWWGAGQCQTCVGQGAHKGRAAPSARGKTCAGRVTSRNSRRQTRQLTDGANLYEKSKNLERKKSKNHQEYT